MITGIWWTNVYIPSHCAVQDLTHAWIVFDTLSNSGELLLESCHTFVTHKIKSSQTKVVSGHVNFGRLFGGLRVVRFSFCKILVEAKDPYCKTVIFASRKFSRIRGNSRNSRKFPARENSLFYSTQILPFLLARHTWHRNDIWTWKTTSDKNFWCFFFTFVFYHNSSVS